MCGCGSHVRVCYMEGDLKRFVSGILKEENSNFLVLNLKNYELRLAISSIIKIEAAKPGRNNFEY